MDFATLGIRIDTGDVAKGVRDLDRLTTSGQRAENATAGLARTARGLGGILSTIATSLVAREVIQAADAYKELNSRLSLASRNATEFAKAQLEVMNIAQRTRVGLQATGDLYTSLSRSTEQLGASQGEVLEVTESINKALIISGTSAQSAQAALVQLGQGFSAGVLRGEELNSVLEQAPRLARAIADGLGVPIGKLREMGKEGELTSSRVFGALLKSSKQLENEFVRMPLTVGQATTQIGNSLSVMIGKIDSATGATEGLAGALQGVSRWIDSLGNLPETIKLGSLAKDLNDAHTQLKRLEDVKISPFAQLVPDLDRQIEQAKGRFEKLRRDFKIADGRLGVPSADDQTSAEGRRLGLLPPTFVPEKEKEKEGPRRDLFGTAMRDLQDQLRALRELTVQEETLEQIQLGRFGKVNPAQRAQLLSLAAQIDAATSAKTTLEGVTRAREQAMQMQMRADETALASVAQQMDFNRSLAEEIELIGLEASARAVVEQARLSSTIALKQEELAMLQNAEASAAQISALEREIRLLEERKGLLGQRAVKEQQVEDEKASKEFGAELNRDLKSAFMDAFQATNDPIKAFGDSLYSTITARVSAAIAASLAEDVLGGMGMGKSSGGGGNAMGSIFGSLLGSLFGAPTVNALGGVYSSPGLSAYSGQMVSKPTVFPFAKGIGLMGEAGPEAILPLKRGQNGKLGVDGGGGGGRSVNVTVNQTFAPGTDRRTTSQAAADARRQLEYGGRNL